LVLVFAGGVDPASNQPRLRQGSVDNLAALRSYIESPASFADTLAHAFEFLTVVRGDRVLQTAETLGGHPLGKAVYDHTGEAYDMYGIDESVGAVVVLKPDGIVRFIASMGQYEEVGKYLRGFVRPFEGQEVPKARAVKPQETAKHAVGEISLEGRVEETQLLSHA
jgi:phenol 2-monooxygenase